MINLEGELLKILCTGLGEGNTNTDKLTKQIIKFDPQRDYDKAKIEIVESLHQLINSGQIQIITKGWELGQEFFFICSKRL